MIKITPADSWFSKCIRIRNNWTCEYAFTTFQPNDVGLHCSHYVGRGNWSVRFDPFNAFAHSYGSHQYLGSNPDIFKAWVIENYGTDLYDQLMSRSKDTKLGREYKKASKQKEGRSTALAAHYKREFERMDQMRKDGVMGRIEFKAFIEPS